MAKKNVFMLLIILVFFISSCSTSSFNKKPEKFVDGSSKQCSYSAIKGPEYRVSGVLAEDPYLYVTVDENSKYSFEEYSPYDQTKNRENYGSLLSQKFKVLERNLGMGSGVSNAYTNSDGYDKQILLGNNIFEYRDPGKMKIVTEDCSVYYIKSEIDPSRYDYNFKKGDGSELDDTDYFNLLGKAVRVANLEAKVEYDKFKKIYRISTPMIFDQYLLRGVISGESKKLVSVQLYAIVKFLGDWGHLDRAYDEEGERHELVKISADAKCSLLPCLLEETVGVELSMAYLQRHLDGFSIKVYGKQEQEIKIPSALIISFIDGYKVASAQVSK